MPELGALFRTTETVVNETPAASATSRNLSGLACSASGAGSLPLRRALPSRLFAVMASSYARKSCQRLSDGEDQTGCMPVAGRLAAVFLQADNLPSRGHAHTAKVTFSLPRGTGNR